MSSAFDDPLDWLAIQYVLGELSETEQQTFEERLANDLIACEAVMRASRLVLTVRNVAVEPSAPRQPAPSIAPAISSVKPPRNSWLVVMAASAAVAILCLLGSQIPLNSSGTPRLAGRDPAAAELVSLWRSGMATADSDSDDLDELADAAGDVAVPGWMLAAVSFEADGPNNVQEN